MSKETKVKDRNGSERIVKRNKLKIGIITLVILISLTLIGVAIYFIVISFKHYDYKDTDGLKIAKVEEARDEILDNSNGDQVGLYFYEEDGLTSNFLLRDNKIYDDGSANAGALAEVISSTKDDITWYGIEIPEENEVAENLFTIKSEIDDSQWVLNDSFEYLGNGYYNGIEPWVINELDGANTDEAYTPEDSIYTSFSLDVKNNDDEDNERDLMFTDKSTSGTSPTQYSVADGTMMLFNGTQLTSVVNSWTSTDVDSDDVTTSDTRDQYHDTYVDWINQLIDHNSSNS